MAESLKTEVLIVGAGLAGLMAAQTLAEQGIETIILERGGVVGGRMETCSIAAGQADSGAQFFTIRDEVFKSYVDKWIADRLVFEWARGWNDASLVALRDGNSRYAVRGGFVALAQYLARGRDVRLNTELKSLSKHGDRWQATDSGGKLYTAPAVILTPPIPQTLAILQAGNVTLDDKDREALKSVEYMPSLVGIFSISGDRGLPAPGAVQRPEANIRWIADNRRKGISKSIVLTAQAGPTYSRQLWNATDEEVLSALRVDLLPFIADDARILESKLRRWRYAQPLKAYSERYFIPKGLDGLVLAGDAYGDPRIEGAALSGIAAARFVAGQA